EIGNVVIVSVTIVEESAFLDQKLAGSLAGPITAIPADGALAGSLREGFDRKADMLALFLFGQPEDFLPAISMAADFVPALNRGLRHMRILFESKCAGIESRPHVEVGKHVENAPDAD